MISTEDWQAILLSLELASITTLILLLLCLPLAWYLAQGRGLHHYALNALLTLPLILPPSVLGFYLLIAFAPHSVFGQTLSNLGLPQLAFSFSGLVVASMIYSIPFVLQPLQMSIKQLGARPWEIASSLGMPPWKSFIFIILPQIKPAIAMAAVLCFAHTLGEFGVILMIGGNIPGETQVLSVRIYEQVEALQYDSAHTLSAMLLLFSFITLVVMQRLQQSLKQHKAGE
ncbi:molybdate ABC transporter permease subunit [Bermanella marisrubri]|uniref:Molybdenum transport system permease n=1 Tax=Bermanella marisrubri TaxID=207949 RepID=Q1N2C0_9GAMM|nr:molybdate ABC transporter permease subunit [Bermanella marisrubri]EAT12487.1 molybdate ABC transporter, permease protein [Oceanobacter sp. RED65] [Bermanella marisrubri]QIZ85562.1 molybdate ABC transporter permease subunit [Bermanella marisrubri]